MSRYSSASAPLSGAPDLSGSKPSAAAPLAAQAQHHRENEAGTQFHQNHSSLDAIARSQASAGYLEFRTTGVESGFGQQYNALQLSNDDPTLLPIEWLCQSGDDVACP
jgi:hypothetical protein